MTLSLIVYLHYSVNHLKNLVDKYNYMYNVHNNNNDDVKCSVSRSSELVGRKSPS